MSDDRKDRGVFPFGERHTDGSIVLVSDEDEKEEKRVASIIEATWPYVRCTKYAKLSIIDWYICEHDRVLAFAEIKGRKNSSTRYPTVFLSVHKWMSLMMGWVAGGTHGLFFASFTDGAIKWIDVKDVDARNMRIAGASDDKEPVIDVPIPQMHDLIPF